MLCPLCNDGIDYGDQLLQHYESAHAQEGDFCSANNSKRTKVGGISTPAIEALEKRIDALFERHFRMAESSARPPLPRAFVARSTTSQRQSLHLKRLIQERDDLRNRLIDTQTELSATQQRLDEILKANEELKRFWSTKSFNELRQLSVKCNEAMIASSRRL